MKKVLLFTLLSTSCVFAVPRKNTCHQKKSIYKPDPKQQGDFTLWVTTSLLFLVTSTGMYLADLSVCDKSLQLPILKQ